MIWIGFHLAMVVRSAGPREAGGACSASAKQFQKLWLGRLGDLGIDNTTARKQHQMRLPPGFHTGICVFHESELQEIGGEINGKQPLS